MSLFWRTGTNYGREAAAFLKRSLYEQLGTIAENNYGQRPPFYWTAGKFYGREAAAFLNWTTGIDEWVTFLASGTIYVGREAAAIFLKWCKDNLDYDREAVVFFEVGNWQQ